MTIYLVGGGPADSLSSVHDQFVASAKKRGTRIAVALLGTEEETGGQLASYADPLRARWPEAEIVPIWLDDEPDAAQNQTVWPQDPEELAGMVVAGGWTPGYLEALRPHREVIAKLVRRGVPYMGFSAGAMVVGKRAIVGGWRFRGRQIIPEVWGEGVEEFEMRDGLALIGPTVDVHADVAGLGAGLAALEKGEVTTVVSIDEQTCLVIDPVSGHTLVEGGQRIHWLTKEGTAIVVRHESSAAEQERHKEYLPREREAAEREAATRQAELERLAAIKAERERELAAERAERQRVLAEQREQEKARLEAEQEERRRRQAERQRIADEKAAAAKAAAAEEEERRRHEKHEQRIAETARRKLAADKRFLPKTEEAAQEPATEQPLELAEVARTKAAGDKRLTTGPAPTE